MIKNFFTRALLAFALVTAQVSAPITDAYATSITTRGAMSAQGFGYAASKSVPTLGYQVVAGGAGSEMGGAGAGGLLTNTGYVIVLGTPVTVTVGAPGSAGQNNISLAATNGSDSVMGSIDATGGGHGGGQSLALQSGGNGGSGGGEGFGRGTGVAGTGVAGQGFAGALGYSDLTTYTKGGGGGGCNAAAVYSGNNNIGGNAGGGCNAPAAISGATNAFTCYAGGGGGASSTGAQGSANCGGGTAVISGTANNGTANTGSGGGGQGFGNSPGANGGSGQVAIWYLNTFPALTSTTGSPAISNVNGYRVYIWNSSGSFTP